MKKTRHKALKKLIGDTKKPRTEKEWIDVGVNIVCYANHMLRSAYPAMLSVATSILTHGRSLECDDACLPINDILELIPGTK